MRKTHFFSFQCAGPHAFNIVTNLRRTFRMVSSSLSSSIALRLRTSFPFDTSFRGAWRVRASNTHANTCLLWVDPLQPKRRGRKRLRLSRPMCLYYGCWFRTPLNLRNVDSIHVQVCYQPLMHGGRTGIWYFTNIHPIIPLDNTDEPIQNINVLSGHSTLVVSLFCNRTGKQALGEFLSKSLPRQSGKPWGVTQQASCHNTFIF